MRIWKMSATGLQGELTTWLATAFGNRVTLADIVLGDACYLNADNRALARAVHEFLTEGQCEYR